MWIFKIFSVDFLNLVRQFLFLVVLKIMSKNNPFLFFKSCRYFKFVILPGRRTLGVNNVETEMLARENCRQIKIYNLFLPASGNTLVLCRMNKSYLKMSRTTSKLIVTSSNNMLWKSIDIGVNIRFICSSLSVRACCRIRYNKVAQTCRWSRHAYF